MGIADRNTMAGVVRAHVAAKEADLRLVIGARLVTIDGLELLAWPSDRAAYGRLCSLLTIGNRRAPKGACYLTVADIVAHAEGIWAAVVPGENFSMLQHAPPTLLPPQGGRTGKKKRRRFRKGPKTFPPPPLRGEEEWGVDWHGADDLSAALAQLKQAFAERLSLAMTPSMRGEDRARFWHLAQIACAADVPLLATNDVLMHRRERRPLADVLICIREKCTIDEAGLRLTANAERHLKGPAEMAALFADYPQALARSVEIAEACRFSLDELRYEYPAEPVPEGMTPQEELERRTWKGAAWRFPRRRARSREGKQLAREFKLIAERKLCAVFPHGR